MRMPDPMETAVAAALDREGIRYLRDPAPETNGLDFYLPDYDLHIEVKQFHSERIGRQMGRAKNVIAVQGHVAVEFLAAILCDFAGSDR